MTKPTLVIMAAGMGSRYGGLKQIDPVNEHGEIIIDFSLYDAMMAGFEKTIFVIKKEMEKDFRKLIDSGAGKHMDIEYAFQTIEDLPGGYSVPNGRIKPWGTCHAVMSARDVIKGPFAVINADDYYGPSAFQLMYDFLVKAEEKQYAMVGYELKKTLTEHGHVARGVCEIDGQGYLKDIVERTKIMRREDKIEYTEDEETWTEIDQNATVSMNFWGFGVDMIQEMIDGFPTFLADLKNPSKDEYLLPTTVDKMIKDGKATVRVLQSSDHWYGVTYKEDKPAVVDSLQSLKDKGIYPDKLWR